LRPIVLDGTCGKHRRELVRNAFRLEQQRRNLLGNEAVTAFAAVRRCLSVTASILCASSCAAPFQVALGAVPTSVDVGSIQLDVREEIRLTQPVSGALVELVAAANENWQIPLRRAIVDTAGRTVFAGLVPAHYAVRVWAIGHDTVTQHINVKGGHMEEVRIRLRDDRCTPVVTASGPVCM
jgi:hypothetical protein